KNTDLCTSRLCVVVRNYVSNTPYFWSAARQGADDGTVVTHLRILDRCMSPSGQRRFYRAKDRKFLMVKKCCDFDKIGRAGMIQLADCWRVLMSASTKIEIKTEIIK